MVVEKFLYCSLFISFALCSIQRKCSFILTGSPRGPRGPTTPLGPGSPGSPYKPQCRESDTDKNNHRRFKDNAKAVD